MGVIEITKVDQPWIYGTWTPTVAFCDYKKLFDRLLQAVETDNVDEVNVIQEQIDALDLRLVDVATKGKLSEFMLHVKDDEAWFRY